MRCPRSVSVTGLLPVLGAWRNRRRLATRLFPGAPVVVVRWRHASARRHTPSRGTGLGRRPSPGLRSQHIAASKRERLPRARPVPGRRAADHSRRVASRFRSGRADRRRERSRRARTRAWGPLRARLALRNPRRTVDPSGRADARRNHVQFRASARTGAATAKAERARNRASGRTILGFGADFAGRRRPVARNAARARVRELGHRDLVGEAALRQLRAAAASGVQAATLLGAGVLGGSTWRFACRLTELGHKQFSFAGARSGPMDGEGSREGGKEKQGGLHGR